MFQPRHDRECGVMSATNVAYLLTLVALMSLVVSRVVTVVNTNLETGIIER